NLLAGTSVDQLAAQELGKQTQLASLELSLESGESAGNCSSPFDCAYSSTISWRKPTEYFESIRDVERRIQNAERDNSFEVPTMEQPLGVPAKFDEHAKLMYDMIAL